MKFTGRNLQLVFLALSHAISDIRNTVGVCPNVKEYYQEIKELEELKKEFERLSLKVETAKDFIDPPEIESL